MRYCDSHYNTRLNFELWMNSLVVAVSTTGVAGEDSGRDG